MIAPTLEIDRIRWLGYRNDSGEEVPAFGLLRPTGATDGGVLTADKPNADGQFVYVNGPVACADGDYSLCTPDDPLFVLYDDGETPAFGENWGAASSSWKLTKGKSGWRVLGANDTDRTLTLADRVREAGSTQVYARLGEGFYVGPYQRLSFIAGNNIALAVADDVSDEEIDVTVAAPASGACAYNSGTQSISNNTVTDLSWNSETYDTDSYRSGTSALLTTPASGLYVYGVRLLIAGHTSAGWCSVVVKYSATGEILLSHDFMIEASGTRTYTSANICGSGYLTGSAAIKATLHQSTGGTVTVQAASSTGLTYASMYLHRIAVG